MPSASALQRLQQGFGGMGALAALVLLAPLAQANPAAVPALYATKAEAEAAAKQHFNCTGAHPMGKQWMPCASDGQSNGAGAKHH
jgi:hypothetical protein